MPPVTKHATYYARLVATAKALQWLADHYADAGFTSDELPHVDEAMRHVAHFAEQLARAPSKPARKVRDTVAVVTGMLTDIGRNQAAGKEKP